MRNHQPGGGDDREPFDAPQRGGLGHGRGSAGPAHGQAKEPGAQRRRQEAIGVVPLAVVRRDQGGGDERCGEHPDQVPGEMDDDRKTHRGGLRPSGW